MGKAAVDLPDPLEPGNASIESTDDLLAQLAGEEIDRLLSEAQIDKPPGATPAPAARDIPPAQSPEPESKTAEEPLPDVDQAMSSVSNDLETLLSQPQSEPPSPPAAPITQKAQEPGKKDSPTLETEAGTTPDERQALKAAEPGPAQPVADLDDLDFDTGPSTPFYVKLLEWVNAPLAACPENVRDIMGKVALITLLNAAGVLVYVFYFRGK